MKRYLSQDTIVSWAGNVVPLRLIGGEEYSNEQICWEASGSCIQLNTFQNGDGAFSDGVLLTLLAPGNASVTATLDGSVYSCQITVHERKQTTSGKHLQYFPGDFHDHSCHSHQQDEVCARQSEYPRDLIQTWLRDGRLDFAVISDHACLLNQREFFRGYGDTEALNPTDMVIFPGCEAEVTAVETDRYGIPHKNSGEIVTINAVSYAGTDTWQEFYDAFADSPFAICALAHPQVMGSSTGGIWNFCLHKNNTPRLRQMVKLVEMGNGSDRMANVIHEYVYSLALDNGFRVSPTCASDSHGPDYDFDNFPGRTIIMATEKTKEAFVEAFWNNRVYATSTGNVKLFYSVNGCPAPAELPDAQAYHFHVELDSFGDPGDTRPVLCQVISDYGKCVLEFPVPQTGAFDFTVESDTARYFFLRLADNQGRKTWSCPVYTGRPCDLPQKKKVPLDKTGFTAVDLVTGLDAALLLDEDPRNTWHTDKTTAAILIDMHKTQAVSGLGHYPWLPDRKKGENIPEVLSTFPSAFRISTSQDGITFEPAEEGLFRVFGGEEIITFPSRSARYVKLEILTSCGAASLRPPFRDAGLSMGQLTVY